MSGPANEAECEAADAGPRRLRRSHTGVSASDFEKPDIVYQIGVAPIRIDILTVIDGVTFEQAWPNRVPTHYADQVVHVLSVADLIANKRASGRPQDLADIDALTKIASE